MDAERLGIPIMQLEGFVRNDAAISRIRSLEASLRIWMPWLMVSRDRDASIRMQMTPFHWLREVWRQTLAIRHFHRSDQLAVIMANYYANWISFNRSDESCC